MMSSLDDHRRAASKEQEILLLKPPFSFFDLIEKRYGDYDSIRRIFSLARSFDAESLIIEKIPPIGIIAEENEDIFTRYPDYCNPDLQRLSFWKKPLRDIELYSLESVESGTSLNKELTLDNKEYQSI